MKTELRDELKNLLQEKDFGTIRPRAKTIIADYRALRDKEQADADSLMDQTDQEVEVTQPDPVDAEIDALIKHYNTRWREWRVTQEELQKENLSIRKDLISELQDLVENEENIGRAFSRIRAIEDKWKETGAVSNEHFMEVQNDYSRLRDMFYHNIRIYKELQEHDLKKNYSLKNQVAYEMEQLVQEEDMREVDRKVRELRTRWDEIGPTHQDHWEMIRKKYYDALKAVYDRIGAFYDKMREEQKIILEKKQQMLSDLEELSKTEATTHKEWDDATARVRAIQEAWKEAGQASRKDERNLWKEHRKICDVFFERKGQFYAARNEVFNEHRAKKEELIKKAGELKHSTNWQETAHQIINLQKEWKKTGHAGPKHEHRLWKKFRSACDDFFNARENASKEAEKELIANVERKLEMIQAMNDWKPAENNDASIESIKELEKQFHSIGDVPAKEKASVGEKFQKALDALYAQLNIGLLEREMMVFRSFVDSLGDDERTLEIEYRKLRKEKDVVESEINQIETNLAFFGRSSKGNPMLDQFKQKIEDGKSRLEILAQQMKYLRKVMR